MLKFIDISNWQAGFPVSNANIDAIIVKATEGINFTDKCCDVFVQQAIKRKMPWGFYHFASYNDATAEADYFINETENYFGAGIPVLDWEGVYDANGNLNFDQPVEWVNEFVNRVHERTGVWPWIYANSSRFNRGGVEPNCMRWVAGYPQYGITDWSQIDPSCPYETDGLVGAWQFTSSGKLDAYHGNIDMNFFYGDAAAWDAYTGKNTVVMQPVQETADYLTQFANAVIDGEYGNGEERKNNIYNAVQNRVNQILKG